MDTPFHKLNPGNWFFVKIDLETQSFNSVEQLLREALDTYLSFPENKDKKFKILRNDDPSPTIEFEGETYNNYKAKHYPSFIILRYDNINNEPTEINNVKDKS